MDGTGRAARTAPNGAESSRCRDAAGRALLGALVLLLAACASPAERRLFDIHPGATAQATNDVWPAPPEVPRYRYVGELLGEQNFHPPGTAEGGGGGGFWAWLTGVHKAPEEPLVLQRPQTGVTDRNGRTYVTDVSRQAVFVFDPHGEELHVWERADGRQRFVAPVGIAIDRAGEVLVSDAELGEVFRFKADGTALGGFGKDILQRPTGIACDTEDGTIYVADTTADNVKVFDEAGRLLDTVGHTGSAVGRLNAPVYLAFARGRLYVSDALNARVEIFDRQGDPVMVVGRRGLYVGNLTHPKGVTVDDEGNIYVVEGFYDTLLIFNADGRFLLAIGGSGHKPGQFYLPTGVWTGPGNRIYVADMFNGRVSIFQFLGAEQ